MIHIPDQQVKDHMKQTGLQYMQARNELFCFQRGRENYYRNRGSK